MTYIFTEYLEQLPTPNRKVERTQQRITLSVAQLLGENDVHALSMNMVAKKAGIAHGTVYRYFPGKSALVAHTLEKYFEFVGKKLTAEHHANSVYERIYRANLFYTLCFRDNVGLMRCHFHMKDQDDLIAEVGYQANNRLINRLVNRRLREQVLAENNEIRPLAELAGNTDPEAQISYLRLLAYSLAGMADELLLKTYGQNQNPLRHLGEQPEVLARVISDIWWRSLYSGPSSH